MTLIYCLVGGKIFENCASWKEEIEYDE